MPSPVGHALGGLIAGGLVAPRSGRREARGANGRGDDADPRRSAPGCAFWTFAALGALPDVDLLFGTHSTYTHSVGAVCVVMIVVTAARRGLSGWRRKTGVLSAAAAGAAYASHLLLDWLGTDTSAPIGIMALWPWSTDFYHAGAAWFLPVSREIFTRAFWVGVPLAVVTELAVLGPIAYVVVRRRGQSGANQ